MVLAVVPVVITELGLRTYETFIKTSSSCIRNRLRFFCKHRSDRNRRAAPDHGYAFVVRSENWIDLILPANTRAFSLFAGASGRSSSDNAWIRAYDDQDNSTDEIDFNVSRYDTRGYGVYTTGRSALTRITVEPFEWRLGYFSSNQGECTSVPEPDTLALPGPGLPRFMLTLGSFHWPHRQPLR